MLAVIIKFFYRKKLHKYYGSAIKSQHPLSRFTAPLSAAEPWLGSTAIRLA